MNDILFQVLKAAVYVIIAVVCRYLIPLIASKLRASKYAFLLDIVNDAVKAYEQIITAPGQGAEKKDLVSKYVLAAAKKYGIKIDPEQVDILIESAVQSMNASKVISE